MIHSKVIKSIYINSEKKDGTPMIDRSGNPFKMVAVEFTDGVKASMFCGKFGAKDLSVVQGWSQGQEVKVCLEQNGAYMNFSLPSKTDELEARIESLEAKLNKPSQTAQLANDLGANPEVSEDEIPFN
jgi:hypothetical protein